MNAIRLVPAPSDTAVCSSVDSISKKIESLGTCSSWATTSPVDKKMLNRPVTAICMVSLRYHNEGFIDTFERQIKELVEVQECYHMAGKVDFFLKIHLESLEEYHEFVRTKLSKIQNIGVLESYFVLKEIYNTTTIAI